MGGEVLRIRELTAALCDEGKTGTRVEQTGKAPDLSENRSHFGSSFFMQLVFHHPACQMPLKR